MTGGRPAVTSPESGTELAPRAAVPDGTGGAAMTAMRYSQSIAGFRPPVEPPAIGPIGPMFTVSPM